MPGTETIGAIVEKHLSTVKNVSVKDIGKELLDQWKSSPPGIDFCKEVIIPRIRQMKNRARKEAFEKLHLVQQDISNVSASDALRLNAQRRSAAKMHEETLHGYEVIERQGRGVVYFGSARSKPGDPDYEAARELGREVSQLLKVTSWTGAGPGAMEAPLVGAKEAGGRIGGVKIKLNGGQSAIEQNISQVFQPGEVAVMEFFGPRKVGLVDAAMAETPKEKRAIVAFPGGFGTLDEFFEIATLKQLGKLGTKRPVPVLLMNYNGYYDGLLQFCEHMLAEGKISTTDLTDLFKVCATNKEALDYLAGEFNIPPEDRTYDRRLQPWQTWYQSKGDRTSSTTEGLKLHQQISA